MKVRPCVEHQNTRINSTRITHINSTNIHQLTISFNYTFNNTNFINSIFDFTDLKVKRVIIRKDHIKL